MAEGSPPQLCDLDSSNSEQLVILEGSTRSRGGPVLSGGQSPCLAMPLPGPSSSVRARTHGLGGGDGALLEGALPFRPLSSPETHAKRTGVLPWDHASCRDWELHIYQSDCCGLGTL